MGTRFKRTEMCFIEINEFLYAKYSFVHLKLDQPNIRIQRMQPFRTFHFYSVKFERLTFKLKKKDICNVYMLFKVLYKLYEIYIDLH